MVLFWKKKKENKEKKPDKSAKLNSGKKVKEAENPSVSMKDLYGGDKSGGVKKTKKDEADAKSGLDGKKTGGKTKKYGNAYRVLVKPVVTEKAADLGKENKYVFEVSLKANKIEVAKAVEEIYGIKPISVNIIRAGGKSVRYGRTQGRKKNWKKAIVKLPEGSSIKIYEGV